MTEACALGASKRQRATDHPRPTPHAPTPHARLWSNAGSDDAPAGMWGAAPVNSGTWDAAARTLTLRSKDKESGLTSHGVTRRLDNDRHEFTTTIKDAAGQVMMEQRGKAPRRK